MGLLMIFFAIWQRQLTTPSRPLGSAQLGALHKHLHPPAQLRLRLDQGRSGRCPSCSTSTSGSSPSAQSSSVPFLGLAVYWTVMSLICLAFFTNSVNFTRPSSRRPETGPPSLK